MNKVLALVACAVLILIGLASSLYLLHLDLKVAVGAGEDVCSAVFGGGCEGALLSDWSVVLGMPLAGWGVVYYAGVGMLLVLGLLLGDRFQGETAAAVFFVSFVALAGSLVLAAELLFGETPLCPFCMVVHGVNLLLPWPLAAAAGANPVALLRRPKDIFAEDSVPAQWKALGYFAALLFAVIVYQQVEGRVHQPGEEGSASSLRAAVAEFEATEKLDIPVGIDDPILGPPDAAVKIVIFSDFQCPACRNFALWSEQLKNEAGDRAAFVFKHFPLSTKCNPIMRQDMHPLACPGAVAAEAARRQGKFWEFHDAMFKAGLQKAEQLPQIAEQIGLDPVRLNADLQGQAVGAKIKRDIDLAVKLKVDSTPAVYWNGRRMRQMSIPFIKLLLDRIPAGE